jgi:hypothetical protein
MAWVPVLPLAFALACAAIVINQIIADPVNSVVGLAAVAAGLPIYYFRLKPEAANEKAVSSG